MLFDGRRTIQAFLQAPAFAVVGASEVTYKFGYKCFKCYLDNHMKAYPVNPNADTVLGHKAYPDLASLPEKVESVSIITPPHVTEKVVDDAIACGVKAIWMQPGAESQKAIQTAEAAGITVIHGGPCLLVELGWL